MMPRIAARHGILHAQSHPRRHQRQAHGHEVVVGLYARWVQRVPVAADRGKADHDGKVDRPDQPLKDGVVCEADVVEGGLQPGEPEDHEEEHV